MGEFWEVAQPFLTGGGGFAVFVLIVNFVQKERRQKREAQERREEREAQERREEREAQERREKREAQERMQQRAADERRQQRGELLEVVTSSNELAATVKREVVVNDDQTTERSPREAKRRSAKRT